MQSFNWVQARAECSVKNAFKLLAEAVENDVKTANALGLRGMTFKTNTPEDGKLIVVRDRDLVGFTETVTVVFERTADGISATRAMPATNTRTRLFSVVPFLSEEGECMFDLNGQSLRLWQVSRKALEDLFFKFER